MKFPIRKKLSLFHYNIGFFPFDETILQGCPSIQWMKHPYHDRFFADPFIMDVTDNEIHVLVEEFFYDRWKGDISLLKVDRESYELKSIKTLLSLPTHLSFPFILREQDATYVMPENGHSGSCFLYHWNEEKEELTPSMKIMDQPLVDPVMLKKNGRYILLASIMGKRENEDLYMWTADKLEGDFAPQCGTLVKHDASCGRRGGDFFSVKGQLYASTQCCKTSYGEALNICRVENMAPDAFSEQIAMTFLPVPQYPYGLHTLNSFKGIGVVDGLTSLFRPVVKVRAMCRKLLWA